MKRAFDYDGKFGKEHNKTLTRKQMNDLQD
jgi:hypothetical protein